MDWTPEAWVAWTCAMVRPRKVDDEEWPEGAQPMVDWEEVYPRSEWTDPTALRSGITLPEVLNGQHLGPVASDWCAFPAEGGLTSGWTGLLAGFCNRSCEMK